MSSTNQVIKELIHSRLVSRDYIVNSLKNKITSKDIHKSIVFYSAKIIGDQAFTSNPIQYLDGLLKSCGDQSETPIEKISSPRLQKIRGTHHLINELMNQSNGSYAI